MASGGHGQVEPDRLDPAKLAPFPKPLDINNDILVPQFSDKWMMELKAALGSRFQFEVLEEADPTLDQIFEWYEDTGYSNEQLTTFFDATINRRHEKRRLATLNLLAAVKDDSLTMMQRQKLLRWASVNDAVSIYQFICEEKRLSLTLISLDGGERSSERNRWQGPVGEAERPQSALSSWLRRVKAPHIGCALCTSDGRLSMAGRS